MKKIKNILNQKYSKKDCPCTCHDIITMHSCHHCKRIFKITPLTPKIINIDFYNSFSTKPYQGITSLMPTETKEVSLYGGEVNITFYPESHRYRLAGEKTYLISVTSCTGIIDKSRFLIPWAVGLTATHIRQYLEKVSGTMVSPSEVSLILDEAVKQHEIKKQEAASIGHQVHAWCESFAKAQIEKTALPEIPDNTDPKVTAGINAFLEWQAANNVIFLHTEKIVYSKRHQFVGIIDFIAEVNGEYVIGDYKTGKAIYTEANFQIAAYREAWNEEHKDKIKNSIILHFDKETGGFRSKKMEDHKKDFTAFKGCLAVRKREKELASVRNIVNSPLSQSTQIE